LRVSHAEVAFEEIHLETYDHQPVYCVRCKKPIGSDATFCPACGQAQTAELATVQQQQALAAAAYHARPVEPPPAPAAAAPAPPVVINVQQKSGGSGGAWLAAFLILVFTTPLGCLVIPAIVIGCLLVGMTGLFAIPMVLACGIAFLVWKRLDMPDPDVRRARPIITAAVLVVGALLTGWWIHTIAPTAPTPTPSAGSSAR
jgi:hypothetical protein